LLPRACRFRLPAVGFGAPTAEIASGGSAQRHRLIVTAWHRWDE
jgi:hypothetical protein